MGDDKSTPVTAQTHLAAATRLPHSSTTSLTATTLPLTASPTHASSRRRAAAAAAIATATATTGKTSSSSSSRPPPSAASTSSVSSSRKHRRESGSVSAESKSAKRRKLSGDRRAADFWCPYRRLSEHQCDRFRPYQFTSRTSIRKHVLSCARKHHPEWSSLSDEGVRAAVVDEFGEDTLSGFCFRPTAPRRATDALPFKDRWYCPNKARGCTQYYRKTSNKSWKKHERMCPYRKRPIQFSPKQMAALEVRQSSTPLTASLPSSASLSPAMAVQQAPIASSISPQWTVDSSFTRTTPTLTYTPYAQPQQQQEQQQHHSLTSSLASRYSHNMRAAPQSSHGSDIVQISTHCLSESSIERLPAAAVSTAPVSSSVSGTPAPNANALTRSMLSGHPLAPLQSKPAAAAARGSAVPLFAAGVAMSPKAARKQLLLKRQRLSEEQDFVQQLLQHLAYIEENNKLAAQVEANQRHLTLMYERQQKRLQQQRQQYVQEGAVPIPLSSPTPLKQRPIAAAAAVAPPSYPSVTSSSTGTVPATTSIGRHMQLSPTSSPQRPHPHTLRSDAVMPKASSAMQTSTLSLAGLSHSLAVSDTVNMHTCGLSVRHAFISPLSATAPPLMQRGGGDDAVTPRVPAKSDESDSMPQPFPAPLSPPQYLAHIVPPTAAASSVNGVQQVRVLGSSSTTVTAGVGTATSAAGSLMFDRVPNSPLVRPTASPPSALPTASPLSDAYGGPPVDDQQLRFDLSTISALGAHALSNTMSLHTPAVVSDDNNTQSRAHQHPLSADSPQRFGRCGSSGKKGDGRATVAYMLNDDTADASASAMAMTMAQQQPVAVSGYDPKGGLVPEWPKGAVLSPHSLSLMSPLPPADTFDIAHLSTQIRSPSPNEFPELNAEWSHTTASALDSGSDSSSSTSVTPVSTLSATSTSVLSSGVFGTSPAPQFRSLTSTAQQAVD